MDESSGASARAIDDTVTGTGAPVAPIELSGGAQGATSHYQDSPAEIDEATLNRLRSVCSVVNDDPQSTAEASRDWWPLAMIWATQGQVPQRGAAVASPATPAEVAGILAVCNEARIPVTAAGGRSGVAGASVPRYGGLVLDMCGISGIRDVDDKSLVADVQAGTFGDRYENELRSSHSLTGGHWPQSMALSTVGGWLACRGAGQLSTRYGKIEDIVIGLDVVLADGRTLQTGGHPRAAVGPDLNQLFVGSEGTLGVITGARLRVHPAPQSQRVGAYAFGSFETGLEWCRKIMRRGARPAVLRLYDAIESDRHYQTGDKTCVAIVMDEGDQIIIDASMDVVAAEAGTSGGEVLSDDLVSIWFKERNNVAALESLISKGFVVDTMEVSASWSLVAAVTNEALAAIRQIPGVLAASAHCSHSYSDGACVYFTFAAQVPEDERESTYSRIWDVGTRKVLQLGGSLSHHHGVGLNRSRFVAEALGTGMEVLDSIKSTLDPNGILNPGKLGMSSPFADGLSDGPN